MLLPIEEEDRQSIVLALALASLLRPAWRAGLYRIALKLEAPEMFETFREGNAEKVTPQDVGIPE